MAFEECYTAADLEIILGFTNKDQASLAK